MGGTYLSPNPQRTREFVDDEGNKVVGSTPTMFDKTIVKPKDPDIKPPENLQDIIAIKEQRLKEIPEDELSGFDVSKVGKEPVEILVKEKLAVPAAVKANPLSEMIKAQVQTAVMESIKTIDISAIVQDAIKDAFGGKE